jgi:hypothetical protein
MIGVTSFTHNFDNCRDFNFRSANPRIFLQAISVSPVFVSLPWRFLGRCDAYPRFSEISRWVVIPLKKR